MAALGDRVSQGTSLQLLSSRQDAGTQSKTLKKLCAPKICIGVDYKIDKWIFLKTLCTYSFFRFVTGFMNFQTLKLQLNAGHKIDITEVASDQFLIWIFNFWPYEQFRAVRGKSNVMNYEQLLNSVFSCFHVQKKIFENIVSSVHTKKFIIFHLLFILAENMLTRGI